MTPDSNAPIGQIGWLKEIEARLKAQDAGEQLFSPALQNVQSERLVSALKLTIEGLEFYAANIHEAERVNLIHQSPGHKAREILEKIRQTEGEERG